MPPIDGLRAHAISLQRSADGIDDTIDVAKALPLAGFLMSRKTPRDFPGMMRLFVSYYFLIACEERATGSVSFDIPEKTREE